MNYLLLGMATEIFSIMKSAIVSPSKVFDSIKPSFTNAIVYFLIIVTIYSVLRTVVSYLIPVGILSFLVGSVPSTSAVGIIIGIVESIVIALVGWLIGVLWLQLFFRLFHTSGNLAATATASAVGGTAVYLLGWIPIVNIFAGFYSIYVVMTGFSKFHNISKLKAFGIALLAAIVLFVVFGGLLAGFAFSYISSIFQQKAQSGLTFVSLCRQWNVTACAGSPSDALCRAAVGQIAPQFVPLNTTNCSDVTPTGIQLIRIACCG